MTQSPPLMGGTKMTPNFAKFLFFEKGANFEKKIEKYTPGPIRKPLGRRRRGPTLLVLEVPRPFFLESFNQSQITQPQQGPAT